MLFLCFPPHTGTHLGGNLDCWQELQVYLAYKKLKTQLFETKWAWDERRERYFRRENNQKIIYFLVFPGNYHIRRRPESLLNIFRKQKQTNARRYDSG
jgi:hypothetical protein